MAYRVVRPAGRGIGRRSACPREMSHTRNLSVDAGHVGKMHYNSDLSGVVTFVDLDGKETAVPGVFLLAFREAFMDDARQAARDLCDVLGLAVAEEP